MDHSIRQPKLSALDDDHWTVRRELRDATHAEHARLNRHPLVAGIARPDFPLAHYRLLLRAYHRFYGAVEPAIVLGLTGAALAFSYDDRHKLPWLAADIAALGDDPPPPWIDADHPRPSSRAELIGVLYAIEGATLGGQVVSRHLSAHLGLSATHGARFFNAYGAATPNRWLDFCTFAELVAGAPEERRAAAAAALQVFSTLESLLDACLRQSR